MSTPLLDVTAIEALLPDVDVLPWIEEGFAAYSRGDAVIPPVGELSFEQPRGDVHIKYGYLQGDPFYVVKIASGFYDNPELGLPVGDGLMLLFDKNTGKPLIVLLDGGLLTRVRTAAAGAIAAKFFAPSKVRRIGVVGAGAQARLQVRYLRHATPCRDVTVYATPMEHSVAYKAEMEASGYSVEVVGSAAEVGAACNLIVTTTPARQPVLSIADVRPGTHITAVGADTPGKQELETGLLAKADIVVADSIAQCAERGEIAHALRDGSVALERIVELGSTISGLAPKRTSDDQLTIVDLTGVAVQDLQIAKAVYAAAQRGAES